MNTEDVLAIRYNDASPLENMHCAAAFAFAKESMALRGLSGENKTIMRKQVVLMILDTDLAKHFSSLAKFKAKLGKVDADHDHELQLRGLDRGRTAPS